MTAQLLVVDDDVANAAFIRDLALDWGYEAAVAHSAEEALALAARQSFDLVVTDLRMPGVDGFALIRKLRERHPSMALIAITAFGSSESGVRALEAGASTYLTKPFQPDVLGDRIRQALERRALRLKNERLRRDVERLLGGAGGRKPGGD
jgi:two-component system, OmpR family, response regulator